MRKNITKQEIKKAYFERRTTRNILTSQNVLVNEKNIDTYITFLNNKIKQETTKQYEDAIQFITELSIHERYTISIIKNIASNPSHICNKSCLDIVNSGYTQHILEDIKSNVFIKLFEMVQDKKCWLDDNKIVFDTYINNKDKETSYFVELYKTIETTFYNEKKHNETRYKKIKYDVKKHGAKAHFNEQGFLCDKFNKPYLQGCKMEYLDSYNNDVTSVNSSDYKEYLYNINGENSLVNVAFREDIKQFFATIKKVYPKYYSDFCSIFEGLYKGYTYKEISNIMGISERRIKYLIPLFREKYNEVMVEGINITKNINDNMYCDRTRNTSTTYYINRTKYTIVKPTIKKVRVQEVTYNHTPNYEYDLPLYIKKQWEQEKQEEQKALFDNVSKHINVIDKKKKIILTLNQEGKVLYSFPLHCKNISKFAKKEGLEIL